MELRQLTYFVAVAEEHNFTRAAERVMVAQPAVSQQILRLERELHEPLLLRTRQGVELTDAGAAFLPHARAALAAVSAGKEAVASIQGLLTGRLEIGTVQPPPVRLAALLGMFKRQHPGVELRVREGQTWPLIESALARDLDIAIVGVASEQTIPSGLGHALISIERVVLVVHDEHRLAKRRSVRIGELKDESMVTLPEGSGQRRMLELASRDAGFSPQITAESSDLGMLVEMAAQAVGVALVPSTAVRPSARLAVVQLDRPRLERRTVLIWLAETPGPAARAFLELAKAELVPAHPD